MAEATLSSGNRIVLPREARDALGVNAGDKLLIEAGLGLYSKDYLKQEREGGNSPATFALGTAPPDRARYWCFISKTPLADARGSI
jgi:hypothetical protein